MALSYPTTIPTEFDNDDALRSAYRRGWNHGHGVACHNVPKIGDRVSPEVDYVGIGKYVTAENIREYHELLTHAGADHSRCYSPFEFTASEFNAAGEEASEALWEAFEEGTDDAIAADLGEYTDEDYGIAEEE
jgi:hypothetical protein